MNLNLSELRKKLQPKAVLALTLESGRLSAALVASEEGKWNVTQSFTIDSGAEDVARDPEKAGKELAAALDAAHIRQRRCVVCVPATWAMTASTELPDVSAEDLRSFLELRAEREFPVSVSDLRVTHSPYSLPDGEKRATIAAIPSKRLEAVEKMLAAAGCRAISISLALDECVAAQEPALHFLSNGTHTEVVVTGGGGVVSMRSLSGLGGETEFDPVSFYREMRITLGRLPDTIRRQLRTARFGGMPESARRLAVETRDPLLKLGIEGEAGEPATVPAAVNAAQCHLEGKPVVFEFIVAEVNRLQMAFDWFENKRHRNIVLVSAGVVAALLLLFIVRSEMESHYQSKWDSMKKKVAELDALQQKLRLYHPWFETSPRVLQMMETVVSAFPDQGDVWAKSIQSGDNGKITCTGYARNREALSALLGRLRARPEITELTQGITRGENPVQFTFTFKFTPTHES